MRTISDKFRRSLWLIAAIGMCLISFNASRKMKEAKGVIMSIFWKPDAIPSQSSPVNAMMICRTVPSAMAMPLVVKGAVIGADEFHIIPMEARIMSRGHVLIPTVGLTWSSDRNYLAIMSDTPVLSRGMAESLFCEWISRAFPFGKELITFDARFQF